METISKGEYVDLKLKKVCPLGAFMKTVRQEIQL